MSELLSPAQEAIVTLIRKYVGCSLGCRESELFSLVGRGVDDAQGYLSPKVSDCGLVALGIWHLAGVDHELVNKPYQNGMAITWLVHVANDLQAIRYPRRDGLPRAGALMHYYRPRPSIDDHVEFCLSTPDEQSGMALHAGGGRAFCAIAEGSSDVRWSSGRPLQCWYDADALLWGVFP